MNFFVTGGSRGLGAGLVLEAASRGHNVAFAYSKNKDAADKVLRDSKDRNPKGLFSAYCLDVSDSDQVENVCNRVLDEFENINVVVNCAGITIDNLAVSMSDQEWNKVIATNLSGSFYVCRQFLTSMIASKFGRIINVSSIQAEGAVGQINYAASKAGLHGMTKTLAKEYGRKGITANVVSPGFFDTDMTRETIPQSGREFWNKHCPIPQGRMGKIEEFSRLVLFLASDSGADYINGQVINLTGGLDATY